MPSLLAVVLLAICNYSQLSAATSEPAVLISTWVQKPGQLNKKTHGWVNASRPVKYLFRWNVEPGMISPFRIAIEAPNANQSTWPLIIVVKQGGSVMTMNLPYQFLGHSNSGFQKDGKATQVTQFNRVARTLCPEHLAHVNRQVEAIVEVSSSSSAPVNFTILATLVTNFTLPLRQLNTSGEKTLPLTIDVEPSAPHYYLFNFGINETGQDDVEAVRVVLNSTNNDTCLSMAIQHISCPVRDTPEKLDFSGQHQMILSKGDIYVKKENFDAFYVVLVSYPNSSECKAKGLSNDINKSKPVTIEVIPAPGINLKAFTGIPLFWLLFVFFSFVIARCYFRRQAANRVLPPLETEGPMLQEEANTERAHLHRRENGNVYLVQLIVIIVFYTLPALQLLFNLVKTIDSTGNLDSCYFNYACSIKLSIGISIYSFNNIFSNIGYLAVGVAIILVVASKQWYFGTREAGTPDCYSLYYACGATVIVEGLMSAAYHLCPSRANFQFDTAFMLLLAGLLTLLLYIKIQPGINPKAHAVYMALGVVILGNTLSILFTSPKSLSSVLLSVIVALHICSTLWIAFQMYYCGNIRLRNFLSFQRPQNFPSPRDKGRMVFSFLFVAFNFAAAALYIMNTSKGLTIEAMDSSEIFLGVMVMNFLLFLIFYLVKRLTNATACRLAACTIVLAVVTCVFSSLALWFYFNAPTDWGKSADESRSLNSDCLFYQAFDSHDMWHFLSAGGIFWMLMLILFADLNVDGVVGRDDATVY